MIVKLFTKADCPRCPAAKAVISDLRSQISDIKVEEYDTDTIEGMAEAAFYTVMATPTILVCDGEGKEMAGWRGEAPKLEELEKVIAK
jgi:glutaredoxin